MAVWELGIFEGTRGRILEELAVTPRTARDLAKILDIQESAARGHLERLEGRGLVVPRFQREGVGRPRKRYLLTTQGMDLFPRKYELLIDAMFEELLGREGEGFVSALLVEAAGRMARAILKDVPSKGPLPQRVQALAAALNQLGFRSTVERTPDGKLKIVRTNCVFRHNAISHSYLLCEVLDKHLTEALLGQVGVDLQESIGRGGTRCTQLVQLK